MSVTASFHWEVPPDIIIHRANEFQVKIRAAMLKLAEFFAAKIEAFAKANAPWTDRTTAARSGLTGRAFATVTGVVIVLFHAVKYGIWLEVANAGKYAIILKSLEAHYAEVIAAFSALIGA